MTKIVSEKLRESARGEQCTVNIVGVCNYRQETVALAHLPDESNGLALKSDDISGCYACSACHDVIDARDRKAREALGPGELEWYMRRAQVRTLRRMLEKGVIKL